MLSFYFTYVHTFMVIHTNSFHITILDIYKLLLLNKAGVFLTCFLIKFLYFENLMNIFSLLGLINVQHDYDIHNIFINVFEHMFYGSLLRIRKTLNQNLTSFGQVPSNEYAKIVNIMN